MPDTAPTTSAAPTSSAPPAASTTVATTNTPVATQTTAADPKVAAPVPGQVQTPPKPEKRKYTLKVDGKEEVLELDDVETTTRLQKAHAAEKRMQEAAEERKKIAGLLKYMKDDPFGAAKELGVDLDALAEKRLAEKFKVELMKPEERAQYELQKKAQEYEAKVKQYEAQEKARAEAQLAERVFKETEASFMAALKTEGVEPSYQTLYEMAQVAKDALQYGVELSPAQLATEVKSRIMQANAKLEQSIRKNLKGEELIKHLGDETVREVLRYAVEKAKGRVPATTAQTQTEPKLPSPAEEFESRAARRSQAMKEFRNWARK